MAERRPHFVYGTGEEPDPRFSLANERTFLAWSRTAMALMAAGVAVQAVDLELAPGIGRVIAISLLALGVLATLNAWISWCRTELALREHRPIPPPAAAPVLTAGLVLVGVLLVVARL